MEEYMKKYLIALDMDGTLLNSRQQISTLTLETLRKLNEQGHKIIISSGRPIRNIMSYYKQLNLDTPIICYNGAYIYPGSEKSLEEYKFSFKKEVVLDIISSIGYDKLDNVILETNDDIYLLKNDEDLDVFFTKNNMCVHLGYIEDHLDEDVMTLLIRVKSPKYNNIVKEIVEKNEGIKLRFWSGKWLDISEIYYEHINKGQALKAIAEHYSIPQENIIAFGDACNDLELLTVAGQSFAMANAEEEVKQIAKFTTEFDNNHDGIGISLQKFFEENK